MLTTQREIRADYAELAVPEADRRNIILEV